MRTWIQVVMGALLLAVLLQATLYWRSRPLPSVLPPARDLERSTAARLAVVTQELEGMRPHEQQPQVTQSHLPETVSEGGVTEDTVQEPEEASALHLHHPYPYLLNSPGACGPRTRLVLVVVTAVPNFQDRLAVRHSWGAYVRDPRHNASLVFLLGSTPDKRLQSELEAESVQFGDLVQEDFQDSYRNLSVKSVALLKWVTLHCNTSRFVLKADDDMFVNVPNLRAALQKERASQRDPAFIMGHVFTGAKPVQNKASKWYTPIEHFSEKSYPRYTSGTAYAMSTAAARRLYRAAAQVPLFWLEDIYVTGLLARQAHVRVVHHGGFQYIRRTDICSLRSGITAHKITAREKEEFYKQVNDKSIKC